MTCEEIRQQIKPFFDDLLREDDYQAVCDHLSECEHCRQYAASTSSLSYMLKELGDVEVPKDLTATVRFRLEKNAGGAAPGPSRPDTKPLFSARAVQILGVMAVVILALGVAVWGKGKGFFNASKTGKGEMAAAPAAVTTEDAVEPLQGPVSGKEAEHVYKQLQVMADSLEQIAGGVDKKEATGQTQPQAENNTASAPSSAPVVPATEETVEQPASFHWHIPYSRDAEREQLVNTVKILGINADYQDQDFLVFKATGRQLKLLVEGVQFSNQAGLNVPEWVLADTSTDRPIVVIIYLINNAPLPTETPHVPIVKKDGTFVSVGQLAPSAEHVLDWHVLLLPSQRDHLMDVIRRAGGDISYASADAVIFSLLGSVIEKLTDEIRGLGGVFADFGQAELDKSALMGKTVKILIYLKKQ